jgi:hypothetical protein
VPDQPDQRETTRIDGHSPDVELARSRDDSDLANFDVSLSFGSVKPLPAGAVSPEAIARLRSDGRLTDEELERLQAAIMADSGMVGRFLGGLLTTRLRDAREQGTVAASLPPDVAGGDGMEAVPIGEQRFAWTWQGGTHHGDEQTAPATYFEALTGRPYPMRGVFVTVRRVLSIVSWIIVLGLPLGLITLGVVNGESPDTVFFMGLFGLIVGVMFRYTLPKSPFS